MREGDTNADGADSVWEGRVVGGKYRLLSVLGRGGMGTVFEVERLTDCARFALKRVDRAHARDEITVSRFAREVRAANAVHSDHIVRVLDVGTDEGCPFLVMDRLEGEDLGARLRREGRIGVDESVRIACEVLSGLGQAHAEGVVHRDLKPDNVFLVSGAPDDLARVKILDFGMSKMQPLGSTAPLALTLRGVAVGTPLYMSPEQAAARADVDARSDLYSVGAILLECLTGRPPHVGETDDEILAAIRTTPAPSVGQIGPAIAEALAVVIDRALLFDRAARFGSAAEMRVALEATREAPAPESAKPARAMAKRRLWVAAAVALLLGVVVTVGAVMVLKFQHL